MSHPRVVKIGEAGYDVYIGRPGIGQPWGFGNPFVIGVHGNRAQVIAKYDIWLRTGAGQGCPGATAERREWILDHITGLKGKVLGCFCGAELACHGDVLARMADELSLS